MTSHTPGPWHVNDKIRHQIYVEGEHSFVCDLQFPQADNPEDVVILTANAWLIAAAPDLLEALKLIEPLVVSSLAFVDCNAQLRLLRAAIAKAEGKATR